MKYLHVGFLVSTFLMTSCNGAKTPQSTNTASANADETASLNLTQSEIEKIVNDLGGVIYKIPVGAKMQTFTGEGKRHVLSVDHTGRHVYRNILKSSGIPDLVVESSSLTPGVYYVGTMVMGQPKYFAGVRPNETLSIKLTPPPPESTALEEPLKDDTAASETLTRTRVNILDASDDSTDSDSVASHVSFKSFASTASSVYVTSEGGTKLTPANLARHESEMVSPPSATPSSLSSRSSPSFHTCQSGPSCSTPSFASIKSGSTGSRRSR